MVEQERLSRRKRAAGEAPVAAAVWCLKNAGLRLDDVDAVAVGSDLRALDRWHGLTPEELARQPRLDDPERLFPVDPFGRGRRPDQTPVPHHVAHAASALWASPFER